MSLSLIKELKEGECSAHESRDDAKTDANDTMPPLNVSECEEQEKRSASDEPIKEGENRAGNFMANNETSVNDHMISQDRKPDQLEQVSSPFEGSPKISVNTNPEQTINALVGIEKTLIASNETPAKNCKEILTMMVRYCMCCLLSCHLLDQILINISSCTQFEGSAKNKRKKEEDEVRAHDEVLYLMYSQQCPYQILYLCILDNQRKW